MIAYAHAKINLGLHINRKRDDGYHDLESVFYPVPFYDILEVVKSDEAGLNFGISGMKIDGDLKENTCLKAIGLMQDRYGVGHVRGHLHKQIPVGSGLGGGSSDGAMMLKALNLLFELKLTDEKLEEIALELGSDCPFFVRNVPVFVTGRGEVMHALNFSLREYWLVLVKPSFQVSTAEAYRKVVPQPGRISPLEMIFRPVDHWRSVLHNDFEEIIFVDYPEGFRIQQQLYSAGAIFSQMTGSGSVIFGLFNRKPDFSEVPEGRLLFSGYLSEITKKRIMR